MKLFEIAQRSVKFKALLLAGPPASGKSYLFKNNPSLNQFPHLNTDTFRHSEARRKGLDLNNINNEKHIISGVMDETVVWLFNHVIYGEPIIIETTADRKSNFEKRISTLQSLGYDVGLVYTHTTKELSYKAEEERRKKENRTVDVDTMNRMWDDMPTRLAEISNVLGKDNFLYLPREQMDFTNQHRMKFEDFLQKFMFSPNTNPKGFKMRQQMKNSSDHTIITMNDDNVYNLYMLLSSWFDK